MIFLGGFDRASIKQTNKNQNKKGVKHMPDVSKPKSIDIGDLTTAVTDSVQRALTARGQTTFPGRVILGIIFEPHNPIEAPKPKTNK